MSGEWRGSRGEGEHVLVPRLCQPCAGDVADENLPRTSDTIPSVLASTTSHSTAKMAVAHRARLFIRTACLITLMCFGCSEALILHDEGDFIQFSIEDSPGNDGTALDMTIFWSGDEEQSELIVWKSNRRDGLFRKVAGTKLSEMTPVTHVNGGQAGASITLTKLDPGTPVWIGVTASEDVGPTTRVEAIPIRSRFDGNRFYLFLTGILVCGSILGFIYAARRGRPMWVRPIPALTAVDEAVGRATEMGKDVLFVPGIQDINDIQTIAGLTILGHVAERTADYRASLEVPTSKSLVMTAAAETVESAYLEAGRQDYFNPNAVSYITDEQFGYVAYLSGYMVREKPAACFYLGAFFAESLILAETGNAVGAVQVAGTAQPSQLPFFVAACDYTLIGEEFFAASAYLSGDPDKLGSLKGQDVGKVFVGVAVLIGVGLLTLAVVTGDASIAEAADYWKSTILAGG